MAVASVACSGEWLLRVLRAQVSSGEPQRVAGRGKVSQGRVEEGQWLPILSGACQARCS